MAEEARRPKRGAFANPTVWMVNACTAVDMADTALLPAVFRALESAYGWSPSKLGRLSLFGTLAGTIVSPAWGYVADAWTRTRLLRFACAAWGLTSILVGLSNSYLHFAILRAFNGVTLSALNPIAQSMLADIFPASRRGLAYGISALCGAIGASAGSFTATSLSRQQVLGVEGWRIPFVGVGVLSLIFASTCLRLMREPPRPTDGGRDGSSGKCTSPLVAARTVLTNRTFLLIELQGLTGAIPGNALQFTTLWMQQLGYSDTGAAALWSLVLAGQAIGHVLGGFLGDATARRSKDHGRIFLAQLCARPRPPTPPPTHGHARPAQLRRDLAPLAPC